MRPSPSTTIRNSAFSMTILWIGRTWIRRAPYDPAGSGLDGRAPGHAGCAASPPCLSLVPQDVGGDLHHLLPGDRAVSTDLSLDGLLVRELFLRRHSGVEHLLGQHVCAW